MTPLIFDLETLGLEGLFDRIVCICVHNINKKEDKSFCGEDESKVLEEFFEYVKSQDNPCLIGFCSSSFDIPFFIKRAVIYRRRIPKFSNIDLRKIANGFFYSYNNYEKGTLRDWAMVLGIKVETLPGSEMAKLYTEKKFDEIEKHCKEDVLITSRLYEHIEACGLI
jgi:uncharacterized protein YprB with RNaseH-like and TPR domain